VVNALASIYDCCTQRPELGGLTEVLLPTVLSLRRFGLRLRTAMLYIATVLRYRVIHAALSAANDYAR
jgi:hypothetical protein